MPGFSPFTKKGELKKKKLPTFRRGTVTIPQYDKEGNKLYNLVD